MNFNMAGSAKRLKVLEGEGLAPQVHGADMVNLKPPGFSATPTAPPVPILRRLPHA